MTNVVAWSQLLYPSHMGFRYGDSKGCMEMRRRVQGGIPRQRATKMDIRHEERTIIDYVLLRTALKNAYRKIRVWKTLTVNLQASTEQNRNWICFGLVRMDLHVHMHMHIYIVYIYIKQYIHACVYNYS